MPRDLHSFAGAACRLRIIVVCVLASFGVGPLCCALEADQLLLITNSNVPQGRKLAGYYAKQRGVPPKRIVDLALPTGEEIPADAYDREVVPAVRTYLRDNGLEKQVTCLVTFYGVPIRIANRINTDADRAELADVQGQLKGLAEKTEPLVLAAEKLAAETNKDFSPLPGSDVDALFKRADNALSRLGAAISKSPDMTARLALEARGQKVLEPIVGRMGVLQRLLAGQARAGSSPASQPVEMFVAFKRELADLENRSFDPAARAKLRELVRENLGPFEYAKLLHNHEDALQTEATSAAFDSELSLLWWQYPRTRWVPNPLHFGTPKPRGSNGPLMVMRLDAPQSGLVSQMIDTSIAAEKRGLQGKVVIDSRGLPVVGKNGQPDPYGRYDQGLRDLAELLQTKARGKLSIAFDDRPEVLEAHSVHNVALYMGWYSVDRYVPACDFVPGAVGFHLASYTMVTLRRADQRCWVRNLQEDGIAATLGAVDEPYLQAFPPADEFFPLILTGKLTLAEVYWKTVPWVSWRISMIGDPLYKPYAVNPVLRVDDLPPRLRLIFPEAAATKSVGTPPH